MAKALPQALNACQLRSRLSNIDITGEKTARGYRYSKQITVKTPWISYNEIMQPAFESLMTCANNCYDRLNFVVNAP
ncbi:MAG: hypothetical protein ACR5LG_11620 [Sodalis sp. (in: enterobacteria)]|uniref:hypothetical protein n=1 Tax=Sodalis sp. (in: enterobacteria) TaxID=1898979 RepID=UPI003F415F6B